MQRASSLSLRVPAALLPSALSEELSGVPASEPSSAVGTSELNGELRGLNPGPALHELDRGFSDTAALRRRPGSAAVPARAAPRATTGGKTSSQKGSLTGCAAAAPARASGSAGGASVAPAPASAQEQAAAVQRVGSRRGPSQPGAHAAACTDVTDAHLQSPPSVSSQGWPSACGSSVLGVSVSSARFAAAAAPPAAFASPAAPPAAQQLPADGRSSACSSSIGECSRGSLSDGGSAAGEDSGHWADSPGSSLAEVWPAAGAAEPAASPGVAVQQQAQQQAQDGQHPRAQQRQVAPRRAAAPRSPAASQPSSRCSSRLGGYMGSTAAAEAKNRRPGSAGTLGSRPSSVAPSSRPGSASPKKQPARPCSGRPGLEARVSRQMNRDPADWTVTEVCDWLELIGLGQYRRRFVHNAVSGAVLLKLSNEELKVEVGIGPLGHREGLLNAINDLEQFWQQRQAEQPGDGRDAAGSEGWGSPCSSRPGSPSPGQLPGAGADVSLQRAFAQRARLLRELEKAEGRQAHRTKAAEQALHVAGQAEAEVRKLQASLCQLDRQLGWQAATQQLFNPLDVHGAVAWQPAGKQRAVAPPGSSGGGPLGGSPVGGRSPSPSPGGGGGSPMSRVSRRIMEAQSAGGGGSFLDRLSRDIAVRQAKSADAARRAGRYRSAAGDQLAEREREARDAAFLRELVEARSSGLAEMLASGDPAQLAQACDELAESYQAELQLSDEVVEAVRRLASPARKAAKLAGAVHSAQFMQRLQQDLSTRDARLQELQQRYFKLEQGNTLEQQESADLAAAQAHFALLGWPEGSLEVAPEDASAGCDGALGALLRRAVALQEARQRGKPPPDWEQPEWRRDGLADMQRDHNARLQKAAEEQEAAQAAAAAALAAGKRAPVLRPKEVPKLADRLGETAELLAACRPNELALLEGLSGYRKLMMCWRAVRAQQFIAFTRRDLEVRRVKAKELEARLYPDQTKVLPKEEFDKFFDRLMADTQRRLQHKDELAEQARAEALAKLMKSAPPPLNHQRQRPASAAR
ncbi:hypothetical protein ABPG75_011555 [Micractinium tetrahymenae]